jgi:hypothetical protein
MKRAIAKKHTLFGMKLELTTVVGCEMRPTYTSKDFKKHIVRDFLKKNLDWCFHMNNT